MMLSQLFLSMRTSSRCGRRWLKLTLWGVCGTIAALTLSSHPAAAETPGFTRPVATKAELLAAYPRHTSAADLGSPVATNFGTYCGSEGAPATQVITDRPLCDNTAIGGVDDMPIPVSATTPDPLWQNRPLQEPMVLQQSDRTQLFPRQ